MSFCAFAVEMFGNHFACVFYLRTVGLVTGTLSGGNKWNYYL